MKRTRWAKVIFIGLAGGTLMTSPTPSCGDIAVASVKNGLFSFVSGSLYYTFGAGQLNSLLGNLFTGTTTTGTGT